MTDLRSARQTVLVIGGGVFGVTIAERISRYCDVDLVEAKSDLLLGATLKNQWRHHSGFHYPLSRKTIEEIVYSKKAFEEVYGDAVEHSIKSYYCVSATGCEISARSYREVCDQYNLDYRVVSPPSVINPDSVSLCVVTDEATYNIEKMRRLAWENIRKTKGVSVSLNTKVTSGHFSANKDYSVTFEKKNDLFHKNFDFVINCTYSQINETLQGFGLDAIPLRFQAVEMVEVELDIGANSVTILDGPFTSLTHTGTHNRYLLSHRDWSVLSESDFPERDLSIFGAQASYNLVKDASEYIPSLSDATICRRWRENKTIENKLSEDWERPTSVYPNGYRMWSVLGGKILTAVSTANDICRKIERYLAV